MNKPFDIKESVQNESDWTKFLDEQHDFNWLLTEPNCKHLISSLTNFRKRRTVKKEYSELVAHIDRISKSVLEKGEPVDYYKNTDGELALSVERGTHNNDNEILLIHDKELLDYIIKKPEENLMICEVVEFLARKEMGIKSFLFVFTYKEPIPGTSDILS